VFMAIGGNRLKNKAGGSTPNITTEETVTVNGTLQEADGAAEEETYVRWEEGWVRYDGKVYEYNSDIMTFLVMGIDKNSEVTDNPDAVSGGQADALFLVVVNPDKKDISIIAVNRDTMTDVKMYDVHTEGYEQTVTAQIATQHGFGDGREQSCELTRDAVSALFYDLPIHGYVSINMAAIAKLNDAIGGVDVTVLEDLTKVNKNWKEGTQITLMGKDAFWYVKWRDTTVFESNRGRLARQKQYLTAFIQKAITETKKDITLPVTLYGELSKYMVTDITVEEVAYLVGELLDYHFDGDAIYTLEGTTEMGEKHEEFYPDYEALKELMIRVFYQEVDMQAP
ncbi:MAG: LCP family protein, partial [Lachnospiraceae bacterium]